MDQNNDKFVVRERLLVAWCYKLMLCVVYSVILKLQLDDGVTYHACDATNHQPVSDACRHADNGWYNTTVNADGFHCTEDVP